MSDLSVSVVVPVFNSDATLVELKGTVDVKRPEAPAVSQPPRFRRAVRATLPAAR